MHSFELSDRYFANKGYQTALKVLKYIQKVSF